MNLILIPTLLLLLTPLDCAKAASMDDESEFMKQHRLFSQINSRWDEPDAAEPESALLEELMQQRPAKSYAYPQNVENDQINEANHYDGDKELESSLPYGIQNVLDGSSARIARSKNRLARVTFQSLCPSKRETVFLNLASDYEYRPDHYEEVTCSHPLTEYRGFKPHASNMPVCSEAGFSCIQLNRTLFLTRRAHEGSCWESETRLVAAGCECMWPKHHLGDILAHH